jgi:hypothetical protein
VSISDYSSTKRGLSRSNLGLRFRSVSSSFKGLLSYCHKSFLRVRVASAVLPYSGVKIGRSGLLRSLADVVAT